MFKSITQFFKDLRAELSKVAWSTPRDLIKATCVVMAGTAFFSVFILFVDVTLSNLLKMIIK